MPALVFPPTPTPDQEETINGILYKFVGGKWIVVHPFEQNVQTDWNQTDSTADDYLRHKPDLSLKADLVGGGVPTSQLPAISVSEFLGVVESEAEMLALSGQKGGYCIRNDLSMLVTI